MNLVYYVEGDLAQNRLVAASAAGDLETIKKLLAEGVAPGAPDTRWGATPLHVAAAAGHLAIVTYLLERGANLDGRDGSGITPLMAACSAGCNEVALALADAGADVQYERSEDGMSALKFALWGRCSREVIKALRSKGASTPEPGFVVVSSRFILRKMEAHKALGDEGFCCCRYHSTRFCLYCHKEECSVTRNPIIGRFPAATLQAPLMSNVRHPLEFNFDVQRLTDGSRLAQVTASKIVRRMARLLFSVPQKATE